MTRTTTVTVEEIDLDVDFTFYKGEPTTRDYEGEDPYVDAEAVRICGTQIDITSLLSAKAITNIENKIFEEAGDDDD